MLSFFGEERSSNTHPHEVSSQSYGDREVLLTLTQASRAWANATQAALAEPTIQRIHERQMQSAKRRARQAPPAAAFPLAALSFAAGFSRPSSSFLFFTSWR